jgi:hypothetical protein
MKETPMPNTSNTTTGPDLARLKLVAGETHDQLKRVHARAHRLCGFLNDPRREGASSQQEDGWYYAV